MLFHAQTVFFKLSMQLVWTFLKKIKKINVLLEKRTIEIHEREDIQEIIFLKRKVHRNKNISIGN